MDKYIDDEYEDETPQEEAVLSRVNKNQVMYDDVYFNRTKVDVDGVIESMELVDDHVEPQETVVSETYEQKSYSINDYLEKAHENKSPDNLKRDIDDTDFREGEDEIRRLIASIDEKEVDEDFFKDLKGENEDTLIGAKFKTDEFNDSIYETLKGDSLVNEKSILEHVLGDKTVLDLEKEEDEKIDHTFEEIMRLDEDSRKKKKKLPIIIFCSLLVVLIIVVVVIFLIKK
jgi:hypothetical protein